MIDIQQLVRFAKKADSENKYHVSDSIDKILIKIAQMYENQYNAQPYQYSQNSNNYSTPDPYQAYFQQRYQPNPQPFGIDQFQPGPPLPIYGVNLQSGVSHSPYMAYFLIPVERLYINMVNNNYTTQQAYQYASNILVQNMQQRRIPPIISQRIMAAFNDWARYMGAQVTARQTYYQQYQPQSHIMTRQRTTPTPSNQYGRTRFYR